MYISVEANKIGEEMKSKILAISLSVAMMAVLLSACGSLEKDASIFIVESDVADPEEDREAALEEEEAESEETIEPISKDDKTDLTNIEPVSVIAKMTHYYADGSIKDWYEYEYITIIPQ